MSQLTDQHKTAHLEGASPTSGPLVFGAATRVLPATPATSTPRRVSLFEQISINVYTFAGNFQFQSLVIIVIPSLVVKFLGDAKYINLPMVMIWGTLLGFAINPLVGAISDYATFRLGRRRPFLIIGTIFNVIALVLLAFAPGWFSSTALLIALALIILLLQFGDNVASAPWNAIIADKVPSNQRGMTAGLNGVLGLLGAILGTVIAGLILNKHDALPLYRSALVQMFLLIAAVRIVFVVYSVLTVKETPLDARAKFELAPVLKKFFFKPSTYPDFFWVLLARFLMTMGMWGIITFLQYYADDVLGGPGVKTILFGSNFSGEAFVATLILPTVFICGVPASLLAGRLSDRYGRKIMVYLSGALLTIVCAVFILFQNQYGALIGAAFFGIGEFAYGSVDQALAVDALPPTDEAGKFMGIWTAMNTLPQILGLFIGGVILQLLHNLPNHFGYTTLFLLTIVYFALGTLAIRRVRNVR